MSKTQLYGQKINPYFGKGYRGENYLIMFCAEEETVVSGRYRKGVLVILIHVS